MIHKNGLPALILAAMTLPVISFSQVQSSAPPIPVPPPVMQAPPTGPNDVVGSVFDTKITWADLIAHLEKDSQAQFNLVIQQVVGPNVVDQLFGAKPETSVTITQDQALTLLRENPPATMGNALQNILRQDMIDQEAQKEGVSVTTAQVDDKINALLKQVRTQGQIPPGVTDDQFLEQQHVSRDQLRSSFRSQLLLQNLLEKQLEGKMGHPITPADFLQARHILIKAEPLPPNATAAQKKTDAAALEKIQNIRAQIIAKKITFADAAKKYSEDTGSKPQGGDLGLFLRGTMVPHFNAAAFSLKPGQISEPIRTRFGYHLIEVTKLGKDSTQAQRDQKIQAAEQELLSGYLANLSEKSGLVNKLLRAAPPQMPPTR